LVSILYPVKVFDGRRLGLNISYDMLFPVPQAEIRVSRVGLFRDSSDLYIFSINGFCIGVEKGLKSGIIAFLFPGVPAFGNLMDLFEIWVQHPTYLMLFQIRLFFHPIQFSIFRSFILE
jgi:hypothetical protein